MTQPDNTPPHNAPSHHERTVAGIRPRLLLKGLAIIATLALLGWALKSSGFGSLLDTRWVDADVRGHGLSGELVYLGIGVVAIAVGVPRQALCFLAGYAFGLGLGLVLGSLATLGACVLAFTYARLLGRELVLHKFAARVRRVDAFLHDNPVAMTVLIRFLPIGSNLITNLLAGVSSVRPLPFFLGSLLGYAPQTIVFVLLGSGIQVDPGLRISLSVVLFVLSGVLGAFLYKRLRRGRTLGADIDQAVEDE
jgi:uncharacterized membrane protein YdjX (TVP38/TMEM64 family)